MDVLFAFTGDKFAVVVSDTTSVQQIIVQKDDEEKTLDLDSHKLLAMSGPKGDCVHFGEYVQANMKLYELKNGHKLSTHAAMSFIRGELAAALRKGPYQVNMLLAGCASILPPSLPSRCRVLRAASGRSDRAPRSRLSPRARDVVMIPNSEHASSASDHRKVAVTLPWKYSERRAERASKRAPRRPLARASALALAARSAGNPSVAHDLHGWRERV